MSARNVRGCQKKRVFVAGFAHETSAFSPIPTNRESFESFDYHRVDDGVPDSRCSELNGYGVFVREAAANGHTVVASTYTWAQPSARTVRSGYESIRDEILTDLREAGAVDMAFFFLHGAQMADGYDDCEGDLLRRARRILGRDAFIGALLDLHANVTETMIQQASALVACHNYPHTDFDERAEHLYRLAEATIAGQAKPVTHYERVPMVGMFYTTEPKMAEVNAAAVTLQNLPGILSVSLLHGFVWANLPDACAGVLAISDGPRADLPGLCRELGRQFFDAREETLELRQPVDEILDEIAGEKHGSDGRPFVIADTCDNPGGGAGSDSTFILRELLRRELTGFALALLWDPLAVSLTSAAGRGATLPLRLGGKTGPCAGEPLDVTVSVLGVYDDRRQSGIGYEAPMGRCVVLDIAGNTVIVNDVRGQVFSPTCFTDCGVDVANQRALIVKSTQHFVDQFSPIARRVFYCETPGSLSLQMRPETLDGLRRPIWPLDDIDFDGSYIR